MNAFILSGKHLFAIAVTGLAALAASGCGPYRTKFVVSRDTPSHQVERTTYAHGFGLAGGGGYFFAIHRMVPCFINWTGPIDLSEKCPGGVTKVEHYHTFGQNAAAAFLSWLIIFNAYHATTVEITPAERASAPTPPSSAPGNNSAPSRTWRREGGGVL